MKTALIFNDRGMRLVVEPENDREQSLLGAFLMPRLSHVESESASLSAVAHVRMDLNGHFTHRRVERVGIEFQPLPPAP